MKIARLNVFTSGWWVLQDFDTTDVFGGSYDETNLPINYAARYTTALDSDGIPKIQQVANTRGPVGQWICWPGIGGDGRSMAQWGQVFPAKITATGPLKAKPVKTGDGSGWTTATDMGEIAVFTSDGSSPPIGTFGLVAIGTDLFGQAPLFFVGGGAGSTPYKVITNNGDGTYVLRAYDHPNPGGTAVDGTGASDITGLENNVALSVPPGAFVDGTTRSDGKTYFNLPIGC